MRFPDSAVINCITIQHKEDLLPSIMIGHTTAFNEVQT
jgi:hypothetical protein